MELQTAAIRSGITGADPLLSGISDDSWPPGQVEQFPSDVKKVNCTQTNETEAIYTRKGSISVIVE